MKFLNAPISEAIFDIRVQLPEETTLETLLTFQRSIEEDFPIKQIKMKVEGGFTIEEGVSKVSSLSHSEEGYRFISKDEKKIVQSRLDGFTFSKLKPYDSWNEFYLESFNLWQHYVNIANPSEVTRLALRYINRIEIPTDKPIELKDYLRTVPEVTEALPVMIIDQFMRLVLTHKEFEPSLAIVNLAIEEQSENTIPIIFDIDVFQEVSLLPEQDEEKIRKVFVENLREFKNDIFFKSITKKTEELFA